jgi:serine/threonine-protein kinase HipA
MVETLSVFLNRKPLGLVRLEGKGDRYGLEYAQSWLEGQGYAISPHLRDSA